jgi:hypothetical protein
VNRPRSGDIEPNIVKRMARFIKRIARVVFLRVASCLVFDANCFLADPLAINKDTCKTGTKLLLMVFILKMFIYLFGHRGQVGLMIHN